MNRAVWMTWWIAGLAGLALLVGAAPLAWAQDPDIIYSTYLGGSREDIVVGWVVDAEGNLYVTGSTESADFPVTDGSSLAEPWSDSYPFDGYVAKLSPSGDLLFAGYFGTYIDDVPVDIALDPAGNVFVTGSSEAGDSEPFLAVLPADGSGIDFSSFLSGYGPQGRGLRLVVSHNGRVYMIGLSSKDFGDIWEYPPSGAVVAPVRYHAGYGWGTGLIHLPGVDPDCVAVTSDQEGNTYVTGFAPPGFPTGDADNMGGRFLMKLDPSDTLLSLTFGGSLPFPPEWESPVPIGFSYSAGTTSAPDLPTVNAFQPTFGGRSDAYLRKLRINQSPACDAAFARLGSIWPPDGRLVQGAILGVTDPEGDPVAITVTGITQDEPLSKPGEADATGIGTDVPKVRADRAGKGDGRVYHLSFEARDPQGATCTGTVTVCVPHDQGRGRSCGDGGALVDSTGGS